MCDAAEKYARNYKVVEDFFRKRFRVKMNFDDIDFNYYFCPDFKFRFDIISKNKN